MHTMKNCITLAAALAVFVCSTEAVKEGDHVTLDLTMAKAKERKAYDNICRVFNDTAESDNWKVTESTIRKPTDEDLRESDVPKDEYEHWDWFVTFHGDHHGYPCKTEWLKLCNEQNSFQWRKIVHIYDVPRSTMTVGQVKAEIRSKYGIHDQTLLRLRCGASWRYKVATLTERGWLRYTEVSYPEYLRDDGKMLADYHIKEGHKIQAIVPLQAGRNLSVMRRLSNESCGNQSGSGSENGSQSHDKDYTAEKNELILGIEQLQNDLRPEWQHQLAELERKLAWIEALESGKTKSS